MVDHLILFTLVVSTFIGRCFCKFFFLEVFLKNERFPFKLFSTPNDYNSPLILPSNSVNFDKKNVDLFALHIS